MGTPDLLEGDQRPSRARSRCLGIRKNWDRTHLAAARFTNINNLPENFVMTPRSFNRGVFKRFENWVARMLNQGYGVTYAVRPRYSRRDTPYPYALGVHAQVFYRGTMVADYSRIYYTGYCG